MFSVSFSVNPAGLDEVKPPFIFMSLLCAPVHGGFMHTNINYVIKNQYVITT